MVEVDGLMVDGDGVEKKAIFQIRYEK